MQRTNEELDEAELGIEPCNAEVHTGEEPEEELVACRRARL